MIDTELPQTEASKKSMILKAVTLSGATLVAVVAIGLLQQGVPQSDLPPNPFMSSSSALKGSVTEIGKKGAITVSKVTFDLPSNTSENLSQDIIYLVSVPNDTAVTTVSFDQAMTLAGVHNVNYYGYKYVSPDAAQEKMNASMSSFTQRFPGTFFASAKARSEDAMHGNGIANFEAANGITFANTDGTAGAVNMEKNTMYALIVNESSNATITAVPPNVCGDGTRNGSEECDDGNQNDADECSNTCTLTTPIPL